MGIPKKLTAKASPNRLQRRFRNFAQSTKVEDIYAENVTEDELVEIVKFAKAELLARAKKYNLTSTKNNIRYCQSIFDLDRELQQTKDALYIATEQLELVVIVQNDLMMPAEKKKRILEVAITAIKHLKALIKTIK